jgi:ATP-dependent Lon protease
MTKTKRGRGMETKLLELPEQEELEERGSMPILPVRGTVIFPGLTITLLVGRPGSLKLVDDALTGNKIIGVVALKDQEVKDPTETDVHAIGTMVEITKRQKLQNGNFNVIVKGISRIRIRDFIQSDPYLKAQIDVIEEDKKVNEEIRAKMLQIKEHFLQIVELAPYLSRELGIVLLNIEDPGNLADMVASNLEIAIEEKQSILETPLVGDRLDKISDILQREKNTLHLSQKIQSEIKKGMGETSREDYLRDRMKTIRRELGEGDEQGLEIEELREKLAETEMPEETRSAAERELERLARMHPSAAEYTVARTYLDWLIELPWSEGSEDNLDIDRAQQILDEDHYDLDKVKKRIIEYLAVRKLKPDMKGPILCFVGPPGVGKTSLGRSIARALGRKFFRMSLGGVRDEAEIRGHRRTYVGALPGRIVQGLRKVESNNPVFMLDEVDKIGMDFRGDPSSALLEVLDPEQNNSFSDHYLEVPFDLSRVMFITTANILETIIPALRDRMEVLELPGYIDEEKVFIAKKHLIPKQLEENGISDAYLKFEDDSLKLIISSYTKEAGLRNLEREIAAVCRGVAKEVAEGNTEPVVLTADMVPKFLGPVKFFPEIAERTSEPGVATGLAWTAYGGDIIFIEASRMKGNGTQILTGSLGDVMKESAKAALSYIRAKAKELEIPEDFFQESDIHIHIPAGAIPKDGPSAGITIFSSLASLLTGRPVKNDIAMTGEITLRGAVLPVGGIKEKVLAAKRAGIKRIILPHQNQKDVDDIAAHLKEALEFHFVEGMEEVIDLALTNSHN